MLIVVGLLLIIVLTVATGYFVAQEFGYVAVDRGRLKQLADDGDQSAARALEVTGRLSFMLSGAQLGITVTALLVGYVAEPFLGAGLAELLGVAGVSTAVSLPLSLVLALTLATVVQMVLGELAPKNLAIARPEQLAKALSRSTLIYLRIAGPLIKLFDRAAVRLLRRIGIEPIEELPSGATPQDLEQIIAESRQEGHLTAEMSTLLDRGLDFRGLTAGEAMVPRVDVHTVRAHEPLSRVVELLDTGKSRFPVRGTEGVDDLVGVVGIADVLGVPPEQRATTPVSAVAGPPLLVPETLPLPTVLDRLRSGHRQLACVVDEYGGFAGVITLEDIAEELVGPIRDEDDPPERAPARQEDGSWVVPARWRIDEVADSTGIALPEAPEYDTLSGLVMRELGRVPEVGDRLEISLPADGEGGAAEPRALVEVLAVDRHVADSVRLRIAEPGEVSA
ncbi:hemolysin family protein [Micromonospora peucetia]|uniref:Hemolysin family protein n=1 Tax=Micromonospora peucetia TaxID=47871 RepID=A0A1C6U3A7_9ACTN|nr:hemolysin family protein [Micromonospora peucetia]MCX4386001.1 hemolysin family protein [Micromonospora peucetia]WSA33369.1 hemolysin family protein [Micromonospora peucetia]SCL48545.1 Hemolysin, contains CBS domains [Micromonospora peucetia]